MDEIIEISESHQIQSEQIIIRTLFPETWIWDSFSTTRFIFTLFMLNLYRFMKGSLSFAYFFDDYILSFQA